MESKKSEVEVADVLSRKRAVVVAAAALFFVGAQLMQIPLFGGAPRLHELQHLKLDLWALNATLLLIGLAGGAVPWMKSPRIRALMNDEVTRSNMRTAMATGFWVAMVSAMGLYWLPATDTFSSRAVVYLIVTASVTVALLAFSWLELRAHRNA